MPHFVAVTFLGDVEPRLQLQDDLLNPTSMLYARGCSSWLRQRACVPTGDRERASRMAWEVKHSGGPKGEVGAAGRECTAWGQRIMLTCPSAWPREGEKSSAWP